MKIRVALFGLAACTTLCAIPENVCAKIFPMIFVTTTSGRTVIGAASPNGTPLPFGGHGTIEESIGSPADPHQFSAPVIVGAGSSDALKGLAVPTDIAVSDDIIYAVIAGKGIISAFSTSGNLINPFVAPVSTSESGIASFGGNVFVADRATNRINGYTPSGVPVLSITNGVRHPQDVVASGGNLFVLNKGTGNLGEYITEYDGATGLKIDGNIVQGLHGKIQFAVVGGDLFLLHNGPGGGAIDELDLVTQQLMPNFITGLHGSIDMEGFDDQLFVTNVPNHSIDVYDIPTGHLTQITGLQGNPKGVWLVPQTASVPDQSAAWMLLLLGLIGTFGLKVMVRQPA